MWIMYSKVAVCANKSVNRVKSWIQILPGTSNRNIQRSNSFTYASEKTVNSGRDRSSSFTSNKPREWDRSHLNNLLKQCRSILDELTNEPTIRRLEAYSAALYANSKKRSASCPKIKKSVQSHRDIQSESRCRDRKVGETTNKYAVPVRSNQHIPDGRKSIYLDKYLNTNNAVPDTTHAGKIRLCLQYFGSSRALRVIVLEGSELKACKGHIFVKLSVQSRESFTKNRKLHLHKVEALENVVFNEEVYFEDIGESEIDELTLTVRLYNKQGLFKSSKRLGEMVVPVFKYDISMDTNVMGTLRQPQTDEQDANGFGDADVMVFSKERSIEESTSYKNTRSSYRRMNSAPCKMPMAISEIGGKETLAADDKSHAAITGLNRTLSAPVRKNRKS